MCLVYGDIPDVDEKIKRKDWIIKNSEISHYTPQEELIR
jgi:hypothetical protein